MQFIISKFLDNKLDLRVRLFNVLAMAGILVSFGVGTASLITGSGVEAVPVCYFSTLISIGLLYYSYQSGKYQLCYMITVIAVFLIAFPIIFITGGGYRSSMPFYFIFAVIFTAFMLNGKKCFSWRESSSLPIRGFACLRFIIPNILSGIKQNGTLPLT